LAVFVALAAEHVRRKEINEACSVSVMSAPLHNLTPGDIWLPRASRRGDARLRGKPRRYRISNRSNNTNVSPKHLLAGSYDTDILVLFRFCCSSMPALAKFPGVAWGKSFTRANRACKCVMIQDEIPRDWRLLGTGQKIAIIMSNDSSSFRLMQINSSDWESMLVILCYGNHFTSSYIAGHQ